VQDEETPRQLQDRTGRHRCISCLADITAEEYFRNDFLCDQCASLDAYPFASTPDETKKDEK
jgi:hypothetical protein